MCFALHTCQAEAVAQRAARYAQWSGHTLAVSGNPFPGVDGVYAPVGELNGAPYGRNAVSGALLCFFPSTGAWSVAGSMESAVAGIAVAFVACDAKSTCVPLGAREWKWLDVKRDDWQLAASVCVIRLAVEQPRDRGLVCQGSGNVCACPTRL